MTLENAKVGDWLIIYGAGQHEMEPVVNRTKTRVKTDHYTFYRYGIQVTRDTWHRRHARIATVKERFDFLDVKKANSITYQVEALIKKISQANDSIIHNLRSKRVTGYVSILRTASAHLEAALTTLEASPSSTPSLNHDD